MERDFNKKDSTQLYVEDKKSIRINYYIYNRKGVGGRV